MTSTKKVTYKQIKALHTKLDAILHLVKIKGKISTLTLSADTGTTVPQAGKKEEKLDSTWMHWEEAQRERPSPALPPSLLQDPDRGLCPNVKGLLEQWHGDVA